MQLTTAAIHVNYDLSFNYKELSSVYSLSICEETRFRQEHHRRRN